MSSGFFLPPAQHATFAVISRLLSCLVTESLLRAYYIPLSGISDVAGFAVILSTHLISEQPIIHRSLRPHDVFAIVPLKHTPVLGEGGAFRHGRAIGLLDPLDMVPVFYELSEMSSEANYVRTSLVYVSLVCSIIFEQTRITSKKLSSIVCFHPPGNWVTSDTWLKSTIPSTSGGSSWKASLSKNHLVTPSKKNYLAHMSGKVGPVYFKDTESSIIHEHLQKCRSIILLIFHR